MPDITKFYIDGQWVDPLELDLIDVINPATEKAAGQVAIGSAADVDAAVDAARRAFETWGQTTVEERLDVLNRVIAEYQTRMALTPPPRSPRRWARPSASPTPPRCPSASAT